MRPFIPGSNLPYSDSNADAFSYIAPLVTAAGGLTLSQLCAITGLEGSTIQNWVKRGWLKSDKAKKYDERQVARVLVINALRPCLPLDGIARLLDLQQGEEVSLYNRFTEALRKHEPPTERTLLLMVNSYKCAEQILEANLLLGEILHNSREG